MTSLAQLLARFRFLGQVYTLKVSITPEWRKVAEPFKSPRFDVILVKKIIFCNIFRNKFWWGPTYVTFYFTAWEVTGNRQSAESSLVLGQSCTSCLFLLCFYSGFAPVRSRLLSVHNYVLLFSQFSLKKMSVHTLPSSASSTVYALTSTRFSIRNCQTSEQLMGLVCTESRSIDPNLVFPHSSLIFPTPGMLAFKDATP